jgi:hypothetical protein
MLVSVLDGKAKQTFDSVLVKVCIIEVYKTTIDFLTNEFGSFI